MKTHKEEAEEIVEKFRPHADTWDCYHDAPSQDKNDIKCAIIHVEGLIKECQRIKFQFDISYAGHFATNEIIKRWNQILTELKNM